MSIQATIESKLLDAFGPVYLEVTNESSSHNVPPDSETHFKVVMVAEGFAGERLLARHRRVNRLLADELAGGVHALALHTYTPGEWEARFGAVPDSPACLGGGRHG
ncbi:MAG: BolA/IbaG family iron-sulfur metabolism protein [Gammaproteobacteria bacterium]|nr:BolA/IbaG family iron-sulfur metabolism protein [Gammaproteobacteria bacterium]